MADVRPFRAVRYARPSAAVTAPPYDVIDDVLLAELRARDPHNVVHLTLEPDAAVAGARYRSWLDSGVLVRDETPAVWWVEQDSVGPDGVGRRRDGILASLRAEPYPTRAVLPHEQTHAGPIESRLRLLRAAGAQLEPIFLLYEGEPPLAAPATAPDVDVGGTRLWRVEDPGVAAFFAERQLLVADGHHRYETALAFAAEGGGDRLPVVLVSTSDPGLEIFPTHRVFAGRRDIEPPGEACPSVEDALAALDRGSQDEPLLAFLHGDGARLVRPAEGELDVELVERFGHEGLSYTPDRAEAARRVATGQADCAFLLRPPRIADVLARARAGVPLPPKTTYFFPKLLSGLVFHPLDP